MQFRDDLEFAQSLDAGNTHNARDQFIIPPHGETGAIYFLGNSLGLQPKAAAARMQEVLDTWSTLGVEGFFKGDTPWLQYHDLLARPLCAIVGARPDEVVVMNSLTVNLHLMLASFYEPVGKRTKILCEAKAFPSDQYTLETHIRQRGLDPDEVLIEVGPRGSAATIDEADILAAIEENKDTLALVFWGGVNYYTGQLFDMQAIAKAGKAVGAKVGFDLAHAAGNVALQLHDWEVDFACWCSYKYLNSGPGAVGAAFIHQRYHDDTSLQRLAGWWGYKKETRFQMQKGFVPVSSAEGWGLSTPSPLLFAAHLAALQIFEHTPMHQLAGQGKAMSSYLIFLLESINNQLPGPLIKVITPAEEAQRGCQVSMLMLQNGKQIFDELAANGVFADWREPDVIRVAPVPLYNTFEEIWKFRNILLAGLQKNLHYMTRAQLKEQIFSKKTYLCVGLDTDPERIPKHLHNSPDAVFEFNKAIIDSTKEHCVAYKINTAFYEAQGLKGWEAMERTVAYIPDTHFKIADAKRGDIGNTSVQYAKAFFKLMNFDAVTVAPYMGEDSVKPFLEFKNKWTILLGLTSNKGASDFELQTVVNNAVAGDGAISTDNSKTCFLYEKVVSAAMSWGTEENLMFVVGATQSSQLANLRKLAPSHFFLVPGVGAQGGSLKGISEAALTKDCGLLVNASRAIIYASEEVDFAAEAAAIAQQYHFEMRRYLEALPASLS